MSSAAPELEFRGCSCFEVGGYDTGMNMEIFWGVVVSAGVFGLLVWACVGPAMIADRVARNRRARELEARWCVEPKDFDGVGRMTVRLVKRGTGGEAMGCLFLGTVDVSEDGWSSQLDSLLADANNKVGVLNAQIPASSSAG